MTISLPDIGAVAYVGDVLTWVGPDGDIQTAQTKRDASELLRNPVLVCNAPFVSDRTGLDGFSAFDILELFAFVRPAQFCVPNPVGVCRALGVSIKPDAVSQCMGLVTATEKLLNELAAYSDTARNTAIATARAMCATAPIWRWGPFVLNALGAPMNAAIENVVREAIAPWRALPEWEEQPPRGASGQNGITHAESRAQLNRLVENVVKNAEPRPEQADYAASLSAAFAAPNNDDRKPTWVMAEAGTGVGKTLGYLAPALAWATKNDGTVWISTYTRHLQNQLQHDLDRIFPKSGKVQAVVRKGRENYLCLLNLDEAFDQFLTGDYTARMALGLMLRWAFATRDGDLTGGDLPGWLVAIAGVKNTLGHADRRGDCIHQSCPHYQRCFIERSIRTSRDATVIVANHALTLTQNFDVEDNDDGRKALPTRFVFDEGHHIFEAADSAYCVSLTGHEAADMKRWLMGETNKKRTRNRGLARRLGMLVGDSHALMGHIAFIRDAAAFLPDAGWLARAQNGDHKNEGEAFFRALMLHTLAHAEAPNSPYSIETIPQNLNDTAMNATRHMLSCLQNLLSRLDALLHDLNILADDTKDPLVLRGISTLVKSVRMRAIDPMTAWTHVVRDMTVKTPDDMVDWVEITRIDGRAVDVGIYRHLRDPMQQFTNVMNMSAHGVAVTSATLKPNRGDSDADWAAAEQRLGGAYLRANGNAPLRVNIPSPFNYPAQTRIILVNDVDNNDTAAVAAAYATLFRAAGGGGMGLFTAIKRLKAVQPHLKTMLGSIPLYAQHVDGLNTATLVDIFKAEEDACILGTDALRDGVDVPGRALRILVYDRIPWPRATILHKARRALFGRDYDYFLTSMRLRQSFGRLVRTATDQGVFVMLESALPSRLSGAFPAGVNIEKMTLSAAETAIQAFLGGSEYAKNPAYGTNG